MSEFRVELDIFRGPLDLLLYLVRKHEVEIVDIPIALITEQYLAYLDILSQLDVNAVGDFLEMASTLTEIKSRMVLPRGGEIEEETDDPRQELVRKLLEYKQFKDAASMLEERARNWQERFPRLAPDLPSRSRDLSSQPIQEIELWDLVSAFGRILRSAQMAQTSSIVYDDTPIHVYMDQIRKLVLEHGHAAFSELFQPGQHKSRWVSMLLAVLELVRHHAVRAEQNALFGEIWLLPGEASQNPLDAAAVSNYEHGRSDEASSEPGTSGTPSLTDNRPATVPPPPTTEPLATTAEQLDSGRSGTPCLTEDGIATPPPASTTESPPATKLRRPRRRK